MGMMISETSTRQTRTAHTASVMAISVRATAISCVFVAGLISSCTQPNPRSCADGTCTDPAYPFCDLDATFQDLPNTCIAVTCNPGVFAACRGSEALRCNGVGTDYDVTTCEHGCDVTAGGCVSCVDDSQCSNPAPHCNATSHSCEACSVDADCLSIVCDAASGTCADPSGVVYVSPNGATAGNCGTQASPCSLERGIQRLDASLTTLKMLPGVYAPANSVLITGTATVHGDGATLKAMLAIQDPGQVRVLGLALEDGTFTGFVNCQKQNGQQPSVVLDGVSVTTANIALNVFGCRADVRRSHFKVSGARPISTIADADTAVTVDRTLFENASSGTGLGIYAANSIEISNSIFRNMSPPVEHGAGSQDRSRISFSTFINSPITCAGSLMTSYTNNIMATASGDAIVSPTSDPCSYSFDLMSSQAQLPTHNFMMVVGDPKFENSAAGDYRLLNDSPAIDGGNPFPSVLEDFDGTMRPQGPKFDLGAYEYKQ